MAVTEPTGPDGSGGAAPGGRRRLVALILVPVVAAVVLVVDQLAKAAALRDLPEGSARQVIGDLLVFERLENSGAAFSIASGSTWLFSIIATTVVVLLIWFSRRIHSVAWGVLFGLLLGGTCGNLVDRLTRPPGFGIGHVIDFIKIPLLPAVFNLADSAIVASMCLFVLVTLLGIGVDGRQHRPNTRHRREALPSDRA
ncbi:signal peptidase II [uncultured Amnibacterium sp.]|uniref:signal peptidase II n=1 Tax=uncultured Amnibacterium sp. TaxID=1631851 RepID=UPI0035C980B6